MVGRRRRAGEERCPYYPNQEDMNDLIREMTLTKFNAEILISRLKQWDLLDDGVRITSQRKKHRGFSTFFSFTDGLCYCHSVTGLFEAIEIPCNTSDWRFFIDSSSRSLKAILLHNTNQWPSIPLDHSVHMKETYENVKILLSALKYTQYNWEVIGDFKMVPKKVLMPPLHIKLGLIKQFVKKLNPEGDAFKHIHELFPKLSEAKVKAGVFVGPQVKQLMKSAVFFEKLSVVERRAWESFVSVVEGFLGNHKADNFMEIVEELIDAYQAMGCRMSLKLHVLHSHIAEFRGNMGDYSEEQGEEFHQDIKAFEERYKGQYNESMMGDYIWNLLRESELNYNRQSRKKVSF